jgi:hypothetical protein
MVRMWVIVTIYPDLSGLIFCYFNGTVDQHYLDRNVDTMGYPLVVSNIAIENDHRNSGFSH